MSEADRSETTAFPAVLTWRAPDVSRMESVRVQLSGNRIKAYGRVVAAATEAHPAFSASYDLVTDENGAYAAPNSEYTYLLMPVRLPG